MVGVTNHLKEAMSLFSPKFVKGDKDTLCTNGAHIKGEHYSDHKQENRVGFSGRHLAKEYLVAAGRWLLDSPL